MMDNFNQYKLDQIEQQLKKDVAEGIGGIIMVLLLIGLFVLVGVSLS